MKDDLVAALGQIDDQLIRDAEDGSAASKKNDPVKRILALVATVTLVFATALTLWLWGNNGGLPVSGTKVEVKEAGMQVSPVRNKEYGMDIAPMGQASLRIPEFSVGITVEATITVLSGTYETHTEFYVAKAEVVDRLLGEDIPSVIYLQYYCSQYSRDLFSAEETYLLSLVQVGLDDYGMIDVDKNKVVYFPHMYEIHVGPEWGSAISFTDGVANGRLPTAEARRAAEDVGRPLDVQPGDTKEEAKKQILARIEELRQQGTDLSEYRHITADDLFFTEEAKVVREQVSADGQNVFFHTLSGSVVTYTRIIHGFDTSETVVLTWEEGEVTVTRSSQCFTEKDLAAVPDIGQLIESLDLSTLSPPHRTDTAGMKKQRVAAEGWYRKVDGQVYGAVRVLWWYKTSSGGIAQDDLFFLVSSDGSYRRIERAELREFFGSDELRTKVDIDYDSTYVVMH